MLNSKSKGDAIVKTFIIFNSGSVAALLTMKSTAKIAPL